MLREITMGDINKDAGRLITAVEMRGDTFIVSRYGRPAAALVPIEVWQIYENNRERLHAFLAECQAEQAEKNPAKTEQVIAEAMAELRHSWRREGTESSTKSNAAAAESRDEHPRA